jgi:steroid 5-alpha reductase family enzyme
MTFIETLLSLTPLQAHLLYGGAIIAVSLALLAFVTSEVTGNYSQIDKLWSIIPPVLAGYFAAASGWDSRLVLMALLATAWGVRLTFNFWRRGGYSWPPWSGVEDYRWAVLRANPRLAAPWRWRLFNLGFVSLYQVLLLLLITLPAVAAAAQPRGLNRLDAVAAALFLLFLLLETVADRQQYDFQTEKQRRRAAGQPLDGDMARGFRTSGLFSVARHPNFAAEQAIWCAFYLFAVAATGRWINWSIIGVVLLVLLFQGSTQFTEQISLGKYPEYGEYRRRVPRFLPRPWGRRPVF